MVGHDQAGLWQAGLASLMDGHVGVHLLCFLVFRNLRS
jgi:hypothetical protein